MSQRISRRELLGRFGLAAASLPLLDALGNKAWAAVPGKRLVCIGIGHGLFAENWLPWVPTTMPVATTSPGSMLAAPSTFLRKVAFEQRTGCTAIDLTPYTGALSPIFSAKWQGLKRKTAFISNLGCSNAAVQGHTSYALFGGYENGSSNTAPAGETIDQVIGRKLNGRTPLLLKLPDWRDDVRFAEGAGGLTVRRNAAGTGFEAPSYLRDPIRVWDRLFANDVVMGGGGPTLRSANERRLALIDRTLANITRLKADQRLSSSDRTQLDAHAQLLTTQRTNLASTVTPPPVSTTAQPPPRPNAPANLQTSNDVFNTAKGALFRAQLFNAAAALKMNKEQAVSIDSGLENEWLTEGIGLGGSQAYHFSAGHLTAPSASILDKVRQTQQFVFDAIADFLLELDTVEDAMTGKTYLDNTLVVIATEHDSRPNGHLREAMPALLVGGVGGFTGGKLYNYAVPALVAQRGAQADCIYTGPSYSRFLHSVMGAFGVTAAERSSMNIQGVAQSWGGCDLTDWNQPLTGLT